MPDISIDYWPSFAEFTKVSIFYIKSINIERFRYENHNVKDMTISNLQEVELHTRFETLRFDLATGTACMVGGYIIDNTRSCSQDGNSFDADVTDLSGIKFQAQVRIALSPYENLLGDKVDISFSGPKINRSYTELAFSTHSETK